MGLLAVDQFTNELEEVGDVPRNQTAALSGRIAELIEITAASLGDLVGSHGIEAALSEQCHDTRRGG